MYVCIREHILKDLQLQHSTIHVLKYFTIKNEKRGNNFFYEVPTIHNNHDITFIKVKEYNLNSNKNNTLCGDIRFDVV